MIYPENILDKLGFTDIKSLVQKKCLSDSGALLVSKISPQRKYSTIDRYLRQTQEFRDLLTHDSPLPISHFYPIDLLLEKAKVEGSFLLEEEFFQLLLSLKMVEAIVRYFEKRKGQYLHLEVLFEQVIWEKQLLFDITGVIDDHAKIKDNASPLLAQLTGEIAKAELEARKRVDQLFKFAKDNGWASDGNLTIRDGRLCIPVLAEAKRKIKGFIHDESATGQTAYIEPEEVFHLNNRVRDLTFERRREIVRILLELTSEIRPKLTTLKAYHGLLTKLDFIRAKALFASEIGANMPELIDKPTFSLINAVHPLLFLNFKKSKQIVVPLNVHIDDRGRVLVVSGPNAGGKSVCMKTVGLLQLMTQSGLLIPADPKSKVGIFRQIFADIGDDQSLESDLSTYSAHLSKMKYFVERSDANTMVLIDEFGTGTDPQFGGPMAEAVLEILNKKEVKGIVTTHYSNLKVFAGNTDGLENASMLFDNDALKPLYILQIGKPGSSYAFEIAQKIGLAKQVLQLAKQKIGTQQQHVDTLLVDLEKEKLDIMESKRSLQQQQDRIDKLHAENVSLQNYLNEHKNVILKQAKQEARNILQNANKLVENTIADIKQVKADKQKTMLLREKLKSELDKNREKTSPVTRLVDAEKQEFSVGDWVRILETGNEAQVIEISKQNLILAMGSLRTVQKKKNVERISKTEARKAARSVGGVNTLSADFFPEIDVRGLRTEDALQGIESLLDQALMRGYPSMKIIHGKGNGILRKFIREYLRKYDQISRIEDEHADRGGDGITYAYFD